MRTKTSADTVIETLYFSDVVAALSGYTRDEYEILVESPAEDIICNKNPQTLSLRVK